MSRPLMNTREVAEYLRLKERKIYDLVAQRRIPCTRAGGKWLFPKELIDLWLLQQAEGVPERLPAVEPPPIVSGSHDPLLDWAVRESGSGLAVLFDGSLDGLERLLRHETLACGLHVPDPEGDGYNSALLNQRAADQPLVAIEWARRRQGLMVAAGNPLGITGIADLAGKRFALRQKEAGSHILLDRLLTSAGLTFAEFAGCVGPLRSETELAQAIADGEADAGLGIAAAARPLRLDFIPLVEERYDLLIWRRQYFEPPLQALLGFCHGEAFRRRARELDGYDVSGLGTVRFNGRG